MSRKSETAIAYYYENYIIQSFKLVFHERERETAEPTRSFSHFIKVI